MASPIKASPLRTTKVPTAAATIATKPVPKGSNHETIMKQAKVKTHEGHLPEARTFGKCLANRVPFASVSTSSGFLQQDTAIKCEDMIKALCKAIQIMRRSNNGLSAFAQGVEQVCQLML